MQTCSVRFNIKIERRMFLINPLNAELYSISYMLALLGAHPVLHVSRIRVNVPTMNVSNKLMG
jgi:hypothetical protein